MPNRTNRDAISTTSSKGRAALLNEDDAGLLADKDFITGQIDNDLVSVNGRSLPLET